MSTILGRAAARERLGSAEAVGSAVTIGSFDGVHIGHQALFAIVAREAAVRGLTSAVVTFAPHPVAFFHGDEEFHCLATHFENLRLLEDQPLDHVAVIEFTAALAMLDPREFAERILVDALKTRCLVMGPSHRFGKGRAGDIEAAKVLGAEMGFEVVEAAPTELDGELVSSTRIRDALDAADVASARRMLGRPYSITGIVEEGERRGRSLGYPTANLIAPPCKIMPPDGVYAGLGQLEDGPALSAVIYVGRSPTFQGRSEVIVECHILRAPGAPDLGDLYGRELTALFIQRLREDRVFDGPASLCAQIERDIARAREVLADKELSSVR